MFWVGLGLIVYVLIASTNHIPVQQYRFLSLIYGRGGRGGPAYFVRLTTKASSLGTHTTTVVQKDISTNL